MGTRMTGAGGASVLHLHRLVDDRAGTADGWRRLAACKGVDPAVFHPEDDDLAAVEAAKDVCARCPVRQACLEHALSVREPDGVWGGLTARERRREIRRRRRTA